MVIDSIQTMYTEFLQSAPGSVAQVRESAAQLVHLERPAWLLTHPDLRDVPRVRVVMDALGAALC